MPDVIGIRESNSFGNWNIKVLWPFGLHLQLVGLLGEMEMRDVSYIYNNGVKLVGTERGRECWPPLV